MNYLVAALAVISIGLFYLLTLAMAKTRLCRLRMETAESDADRLAPIVAQYIKDCDETAALLKDEFPLPLVAEREALRLHDEAVKLRTK